MNRKQRGFSLIEIMVTMVIVLILSAGGTSAWQRWQAQQHLWQSVQQLRNYLTLLRDDANWHNRDHLLRLEREGEQWCIGTMASGVKPCTQGDVFQFTPRWPDIRLVEITSGLAFYGLRNTAWPGHIRICNSAGEWQVILSVWGRIRVNQVAGEGLCP